VALLRVLTRPPERAHGRRHSPGEILAERFALGEIDKDEYRRRLGSCCPRGRW